MTSPSPSDAPQERFKPSLDNINTVQKRPLGLMHLTIAGIFLLATIGNAILWLTGQQLASAIIAMVLAVFVAIGLVFSRWLSGGRYAGAFTAGYIAQPVVIVSGFLGLFPFPAAATVGFLLQTVGLLYSFVVIFVASFPGVLTGDAEAEVLPATEVTDEFPPHA
jgi:hypothetical protein